MPTVCKTWFTPIEFLLPRCTMKLEPEEGQSDCGVCATPVDPGGSCTTCESTHQIYMYDVTVTYQDFNGAGFEVVGANAGVDCCEQYNDTFRVYRVSDCRWESREEEKRCYSPGQSYRSLGPDAYNQEVICDSYPGDPYAMPGGLLWNVLPRPRVVLTAQSNLVLGVPRVGYLVQVNWLSLVVLVYPIREHIRCHIQAKGEEDTCIDVATCSYFLRAPNPTWTTPCAITWPFTHMPTMSAVVTPVLP